MGILGIIFNSKGECMTVIPLSFPFLHIGFDHVGENNGPGRWSHKMEGVQSWMTP